MHGRTDRIGHKGRARTARACVVVAGAALTALLPPAPILAGSAVPAYDHIFLVVDSGQPASAVIGPAAPYLTSLASANALATGYTAVDPSSLADRFALTAGQTYGVTDCLPAQCPQSGDNLATRIDASGRSWGAYVESMPSPCSTSATTSFAPERVPFLYYTALAAECSNRVVPYTQLATDLASDATTPNLVWISPNLQDDMSSSVAQGDSWLLANLPAIFGSPAWRTRHSLLVVVGDQPGSGSSITTPVPAVLVASDGSVRSGYRSSTAFDHYDLLNTIEASWGIAPLTTDDATAAPMTDVFTPPAPAPTPQPTPSTSSAPSPAPGASAAPSPTLSAIPGGAPGSTPAPSSGASRKPSRSATPGTALALAATPASTTFTATTPDMAVVGFSFVASTTITTGGGATLAVLEFTATSATMSSGGSTTTPGLTILSPCATVNGLSLQQLTAVSPAGTATLSGGVTLDVTSITYDGNTYSPAAPPAAFAGFSGDLANVSMVGALVQAGTASLAGMQTVSYFGC